jgi:hypothetical protein
MQHQKDANNWAHLCSSPLPFPAVTTERRITRWEHEHVLEAVQQRLDKNPHAMRVRRQTVEHPFGTIKVWMGATHFQMRRLPKVASEMALHVLAYNTKDWIDDGCSGKLLELTSERRQSGAHVGAVAARRG